MDNDERLKKIELLLEKMLEELVVEAIESNANTILPIPTRIFLEMEDIAGEKLNLIGLS